MSAAERPRPLLTAELFLYTHPQHSYKQLWQTNLTDAGFVHTYSVSHNKYKCAVKINTLINTHLTTVFIFRWQTISRRGVSRPSAKKIFNVCLIPKCLRIPNASLEVQSKHYLIIVRTEICFWMIFISCQRLNWIISSVSFMLRPGNLTDRCTCGMDYCRYVTVCRNISVKCVIVTLSMMLNFPLLMNYSHLFLSTWKKRKRRNTA